jgi:hypothetical protein
MQVAAQWLFRFYRNPFMEELLIQDAVLRDASNRRVGPGALGTWAMKDLE